MAEATATARAHESNDQRVCGRWLRKAWREHLSMACGFAHGAFLKCRAAMLTSAVVETVPDIPAQTLSAVAREVLELPQLGGEDESLPSGSMCCRGTKESRANFAGRSHVVVRLTEFARCWLSLALKDHRTGQDRTGQDRTGQDRTGQDRTGQDRTGQDRTGQDRTGQDRTGQDRTGQDRTGQDRTACFDFTCLGLLLLFIARLVSIMYVIGFLAKRSDDILEVR